MEYDLLHFQLFTPMNKWRSPRAEQGDEPKVSMQRIWHDPWARYLFLAIKKHHITSQYFRGRLMTVARWWAAEPPEDSETVANGVGYALSDNWVNSSENSQFTDALFDCVRNGVPKYEITWVPPTEKLKGAECQSK